LAWGFLLLDLFSDLAKGSLLYDELLSGNETT
jgi:hypothetical protein